MTLSRDAILGSEDRETRTLDVPEWGGKVILSTMTGTDRNAFEQSMMRFQGDQAVPNMANAHAKLLVRCIVDESGERVFSDKDVSDLGKKSAKVLSRLFDEAGELNGMGEAEVEAMLGNSDAALSGDSISS